MRTTSILYKIRLPQREATVPFQEILPLRLKNQVSGKTDKTSDVACLQEMAVMFSCLKANDFEERLCLKEASTFKKCYKVYLDKKADKKETSSKGIIVPGRDLNHKQLNAFLQQYPSQPYRK
ncbi:uncharacterized protein LOC129776335 [Toxorhynchites rutilus septentrionalis]|uniref:uncharacterized protein LOC129776335 n=1 Tax=Toxorhynchites rutilus septentrionalis TaxID=329112 RepID=UPI00247927EC|nr:uncharacterized protein LOC129776335 [Toxorhynchites rutilus septentrionalis]XP_055637897.1 uncharacterized protein LOC129776335 [Toxorhynchites rutilus septentrionalis]